MNAETNQIILTGTIEQPLCYSHRTFGENFYTFSVLVRRRSGSIDHLPVSASERLFHRLPKAGCRCSLSGQIRTYNEKIEDKNHLRIVVFCNDLKLSEDENKTFVSDKNEVTLSGFICRTPYYRFSPLGREICDLMLASNRRNGKSDYIPCITWGRNARYCSELSIGTWLSLKGRFQSRIYRKSQSDGCISIKTAYEVSVNSFEEE